MQDRRLNFTNSHCARLLKETNRAKQHARPTQDELLIFSRAGRQQPKCVESSLLLARAESFDEHSPRALCSFRGNGPDLVEGYLNTRIQIEKENEPDTVRNTYPAGTPVSTVISLVRLVTQTGEPLLPPFHESPKAPACLHCQHGY